jgi:hypothetical protein
MSLTPSAVNPPESENKAEQVKKLFTEIEAAAKARDFARADALRNKLMEVDSMALKEIIDSAELIEKEKAEGMDRQHLVIWDHLYQDFSPEEKNCLFYSMKKIVVPPKKILLSHGAYNMRLFFIDSGKVTVVFPQKGKNTVLAQLGKGNLLGEYTFTSISLCSATVVTHTEVELYCLDSSATKNWESDYPGLYEKLHDFCLKHGSIEDISSWKTLEKRSKPRFPISGLVVGHLLNKEGKKVDKHFRGELSDISMGGCCFDITISKKETAKGILARHLLLEFSFEVAGEKIAFSSIGKIVKVNFHMHTDYSVHIQFAKPLAKAVLEKISKKK